MADPKEPRPADIFYVYEHWRPDTGVCFYVGKGSRRRSHVFKRYVHYNNIVAKLERLGLTVDVRFVAKNLAEDVAFALEIKRIAHWQAEGVELVNRTNGGEGPSGWKQSPEHAAKLLAINKGRPLAPATKEKIRARLMGHEVTPETRAKLSRSHTGKRMSTQAKAKISAAVTERMSDPAIRAGLGEAMRGRKHTPETCARIGDIHRGKVNSPEVREKIRRKLLGRKLSPEHSANIAAALKAKYAETPRKSPKPFTDEHRANMSAAAKRVRAKAPES